ncbi:hypothetical protein [Brachyspira pilosicoli]|uniref:hypothetical protein n=1 Tax=Brachyspira pilosicoli TaxID=52584 RepID=UPI001CA59AFD|nr:hypothetical protein [Brachyspira pilosicoli]
MYIPKKLDFINAVLLLLWVIPIPKGTSYGRPEGLPLVAGLPTVAKRSGVLPYGHASQGAKPQISKIKYYKENLNEKNNINVFISF